MTFDSFLIVSGFDIDPCNVNKEFPTFVKYYDEMCIAVFYNSITGECYAVRFCDVSEVVDYRNNGTIANPERHERIELLQWANLFQVQQIKDLKRCIEVVENLIQAEILGFKQHVMPGERVIVYRDEKKRAGGQICTVVQVFEKTIW